MILPGTYWIDRRSARRVVVVDKAGSAPTDAVEYRRFFPGEKTSGMAGVQVFSSTVRLFEKAYREK